MCAVHEKRRFRGNEGQLSRGAGGHGIRFGGRRGVGKRAYGIKVDPCCVVR